MAGNQTVETTALLELQSALRLALISLKGGSLLCEECEQCPPSDGCPIWFALLPTFRSLANQAWCEIRAQHPNLAFCPADRALLRLFVERFIELIKAEVEELRRQVSQAIDRLYKGEQQPKP